MKRALLALTAFACALFSARAQQATLSSAHENFVFEANQQQWPSVVKYMADINGGRAFFESNRLTFVLHSMADLNKAHEDSHKNNTDMGSAIIHAHAYRVNFVNANPNVLIDASGKQLNYRNYFLGNDSSKWSSNVALYTSVTYHNLWNGVDLKAYGNGNNLEYDYTVYPGNDPAVILQSYEGLDGVSIRNGNLVLKTSIGEVTEQRPVAYQLIEGVRKEVRCHFVKTSAGVGFAFPDSYDKNEALIIDPVLVAATYSGSTMTNYGHCATYDAAGNIYTGAISFGQGYPVTVGAIQTVFSGSTDFGISKLNPTGSALLYATYIGGTNGDYPQSMVVSSTQELFIYGSSSSANFPTTAGCFDATQNSPNSPDIVVCHLNSTGTVLIGSTFVGGSGSDGNNSITVNYGDSYRGEIVLDGADNPYIASFSQSANFPTTAGAYDVTQNGGQDGVVFKMNPGLTSMTWSTFLGGTNDDGCYGLSLSSTGEVYVVGTTMSSNFPTMSGTLFPVFQGGVRDGFITLLMGNGSIIGSSTFFGTSGNDEVFFLDLDASDNVYIFGHSSGSIPVSAGVYSNPGSPEFIAKIDPALLFVQMSTVFGDGTMASSISPTAFMVDVCNHIYAAGWGSVGNYPVTAGCLQPTTDGSDFYLLVLDANATSLMYATYFGANGGWEHVDGGTSRFDPNGIVYEAICQGSSNMTTTPTAYSPTNQVGSYDIAVFKIDFQAVGVIAQAVAAPADTLCVNQLANFSNGSMNASDYIWNFGDGSPVDTNASPSHAYTSSGTYTVTLVAIDSASCNFADTTNLVMTILPLPVVNLGNDTTYCGPFSQTLNATSPACTYLWSTGATTATISVNAPGQYWVTANNGFCSATDSIQIFSFLPPNIGHDTSICAGTTLTLNAGGNTGSTYSWNTGAITQTITASATGIYWVDVSAGSCTFRDSIDLTVIAVPQPNLGNDTAVCPGQQVVFSVPNNNSSYLWSDGGTDLTSTVDTAGTYWVTASIGSCRASDTVNVALLSSVNLGSDVTLCNISAGLVLDAGNPGSSYIWNTGETSQTINVNESGTYYVTVSNTSNCLLTDTVNVFGDLAGSMLFIPNCFTPNRNGLNDVFKAESTSVTTFHMQIFNRWGQLVFESYNINDGWDGTYKGETVQEDVYVVKSSYTTMCDDFKQIEKITHVAVLPGAHGH